jgi:hypothetical protein
MRSVESVRMSRENASRQTIFFFFWWGFGCFINRPIETRLATNRLCGVEGVSLLLFRFQKHASMIHDTVHAN